MCLNHPIISILEVVQQALQDRSTTLFSLIKVVQSVSLQCASIFVIVALLTLKEKRNAEMSKKEKEEKEEKDAVTETTATSKEDDLPAVREKDLPEASIILNIHFLIHSCVVRWSIIILYRYTFVDFAGRFLEMKVSSPVGFPLALSLANWCRHFSCQHSSGNSVEAVSLMA